MNETRFENDFGDLFLFVESIESVASVTRLGRIYILMIQHRKFNNGDNSPVRKAFKATAKAAPEN